MTPTVFDISATLPDDMIGRISSFLSTRDQLCASQVSSHWRTSIVQSLTPNYDFIHSLSPFYQHHNNGPNINSSSIEQELNELKSSSSPATACFFQQEQEQSQEQTWIQCQYHAMHELMTETKLLNNNIGLASSSNNNNNNHHHHDPMNDAQTSLTNTAQFTMHETAYQQIRNVQLMKKKKQQEEVNESIGSGSSTEQGNDSDQVWIDDTKMILATDMRSLIELLAARMMRQWRRRQDWSGMIVKQDGAVSIDHEVPTSDPFFVNMWFQTYQSKQDLTPRVMLFTLIDYFNQTMRLLGQNSDCKRHCVYQHRLLGLIGVMQCWATHLVSQECCFYFDRLSDDERMETSRTIGYLLLFLDSYVILPVQQVVKSELDTHQVMLYLFAIGLKNQLDISLKTALRRRACLRFETMKEVSYDIDSTDLMTIPPALLAEQLTVYQYELFRSIRNYELCGVKWRKDKAACSNVVNVLTQFGRLAEWVAMKIVEPETPEERVSVMRRFINLCRHLNEYRNFQSTFAVVGGIMSASVYRLRQTKGMLTEQEVEELEDLRALVSLRHDFGQLRARLNSCDTIPAIPYVGYFLGQLKSVSDYKMSLLDTTAKELEASNIVFINLHNLTEEYKILRLMEQWMYQFTYYEMEGLKKYEPIQDTIHFVLESSNILQQQDLFRLSLLREPRQ